MELAAIPQEITPSTAKVLGKVFWNLMEHWEMSAKEQALLLGVKYHATKLKDWHTKKYIPEDPDKFLRVAQLAGIHKNLRIIFPYNRQAAYEFMKKPQPFLFEGKSPLDIIQDSGPIRSYASIAAIRRRLDQLRV